MPGFTLDARQTGTLADIVSACSTPTDDALPWQVLTQLRALLHADTLSFSAFDTLLPHRVFAQAIEPWDELVYEYETPAEAMDNPFWQQYWQNPCASYPDRTNDFDSVTTASDFTPLATLRARHAGHGDFFERYIRVCLPGRTPGRHLRLQAWRERGSDFTDRDRFHLTLLRPHLERAYWSRTRAKQEPPPLTRRQLQVLRMVQAGLTNLQIAHRMELSEGTVRTHLNNIYARLDVTSRTGAVQRAFGVGDDWETIGSSHEGACEQGPKRGI